MTSRLLHLNSQIQIYFFFRLLEIRAFVIECGWFLALDSRIISGQAAKKAKAVCHRVQRILFVPP
jgi:hypothetical protein